MNIFYSLLKKQTNNNQEKKPLKFKALRLIRYFNKETAETLLNNFYLSGWEEECFFLENKDYKTFKIYFFDLSKFRDYVVSEMQGDLLTLEKIPKNKEVRFVWKVSTNLIKFRCFDVKPTDFVFIMDNTFYKTNKDCLMYVVLDTGTAKNPLNDLTL